MSKDQYSDWSTDPDDNEDIGGIPLGEGVTRVPAYNNIIRELMAQLRAAGFITTVNPVFADNVFQITDNVDSTKVWQIQLSGLTTATTRTVTMPDKNGTLAMTSDIPSLTGYMQSSAFPTAVSLEGLSLVAGDILYATAADTVARLAKDTDGKFLSLVSGLPAWAAGSGGLTLLSSGTPSNGSSTYAVTGLSTSYIAFLVVLEGVGVGAGVLTFNVSSDNGSSYDTAVSSGSGVLTSGAATIYGVGDTAVKSIIGGGNNSATPFAGVFSTKTSPTNAIRLANAANFSGTGTVKIYGVK